VGTVWHFSHGNHSLSGQQIYIWSSEEQPLMDHFIQSSGNEEWVPPRYEISLLGYHQVVNAATAYAILALLKESYPKISEEVIKYGFRNTSWPGRFDVISMDPVIVVDCAHNRDSALKLRIALDDYFPGQPVTLIFGASSDKDISGMFTELLPRVKRLLITHADHPRAANVDELASMAHEYGLRVQIIPKVSDALQNAIENIGYEEIILAAGSVFVAGEILAAWEGISQKLRIHS
jgi:dihydrofolate synthase/folylpolyglutamate synthase